ncbi:MAG: acyltransferase family protein, partial [Desulfobacterales bacterium]|nr:acyltransferase family protein [Desulfobacterales bacterium]
MVTSPKNNNQDRILFLDNLRYLMVMLVVVLHAATSYSNFVPWWSVKEVNESSVFFDVVLMLLSAFLMPVLYFIAGYFAIPSFRKNGRWFFLRRKVKRLGLPLLLMIPLVSPFFGYVYHYTRHEYSSFFGFGGYWLDYMSSALDVRIKILTSVDQFSHSHLWFMSLLLLFFILFALLVRNPAQRETASPQGSHETPSPGSTLAVLTGVGFLTMLSTFIADSIFANPSNPDPWVSIANILQFQPGKVVSYVLYFGLGVYAFQKKWFVAAEWPGRLSLWTVLALLLS